MLCSTYAYWVFSERKNLEKLKNKLYILLNNKLYYKTMDYTSISKYTKEECQNMVNKILMEPNPKEKLNDKFFDEIYNGLTKDVGKIYEEIMKHRNKLDELHKKIGQISDKELQSSHTEIGSDILNLCEKRDNNLDKMIIFKNAYKKIYNISNLPESSHIEHLDMINRDKEIVHQELYDNDHDDEDEKVKEDPEDVEQEIIDKPMQVVEEPVKKGKKKMDTKVSKTSKTKKMLVKQEVVEHVEDSKETEKVVEFPKVKEKTKSRVKKVKKSVDTSEDVVHQ